MNPVMELEDWNAFVEVSEGCRDTFYQVSGSALTCYAGRVCWEGDSDKAKLAQLERMRARKVLKVSDIERLFK